MKTKSEIIQRLLDEKKITVEEAMVLMEKDYQVVPYYPTTPNTYPSFPLSPYWQQPYIVTC